MRVLTPVIGHFFMLSQQPDGTLATRPLDWNIGEYEKFWVEIPDAPPPPPPPENVQPENIRTEDPHEVGIRVTWWLNFFGHPADFDFWMGVIMGTLYPQEHHAIGWTADNYWPDLMRSDYPEGK